MDNKKKTKTTMMYIQQYPMTFDAWYYLSMFDQLHDINIFNCFLNLPEADEAIPIALDYTTLAQEQLQDQYLLQRRMQHPLQFPNQQFQGIELIAYQASPNNPWKVCLPMQQLQEIVNWYHQAFSHCGRQRMMQTISTL